MYKSCFVPSCKNNTIKYPDKLFLCVPKNPNRRKLWFQNVNYTNGTTSHKLYVCEDHFNLEQDAENWMFFKTMGSNIVLKKDVVPRLYEHVSEGSQLSASAKKRKLETIIQLQQIKIVDKLFESEFVEALPSVTKQEPLEYSCQTT